ncbi:hypothetical protein BDV93DRAFT_48329 [Ceratobasidium sp. AG-I]|nr:hypothetical protein BDV93DRAFT_48329 [Ceratobasidium sp. AG-I]
MSGNPPTAKKPPTARGSKSVATSDVPPPSSPQASVISTSSRLVCSPHFSTWAAGVKLNPDIVQTIPDEESFRDLLAIVHSSKTYPNWLYQKDSSQLSYLVRRYGRWVNRLCERLERITPSNSDQEVSAHSGNQAADAMDEDHLRDGVPQTSSSDTGNLKDIVHVSGSLADSAINNSPLMALDDLDLDLTIAMPAILSLVDHSNSLADRFTWEANEAEQRSGIDHLLSDAYRDSSSITFRTRVETPRAQSSGFQRSGNKTRCRCIFGIHSTLELPGRKWSASELLLLSQPEIPPSLP